jgi:hypothetical protein
MGVLEGRGCVVAGMGVVTSDEVGSVVGVRVLDGARVEEGLGGSAVSGVVKSGVGVGAQAVSRRVTTKTSWKRREVFIVFSAGWLWWTD